MTQAEWDALQAEVRAAAARARVSEQTLAAVAERLGTLLAQDGRIDIRQILDQLDALAARIVDLEARLVVIGRQEDVAALSERAQALLNAGDLDGAAAALSQARQVISARNQRQREQLAASELEEASIAGSQAQVAFLQADYRAAAVLFWEAAQLTPEGRREKWLYTFSAGVSLTRVWSDTPRREAIAVFRAASQLADEGSADWLRTQVALGEALLMNGVAIRVEMPMANEGAEMRASTLEAIAILTAALQSDRLADDITLWGSAQLALARAHAIFTDCGDREHLTPALNAARAAQQAFREGNSRMSALAAQGMIERLERPGRVMWSCPW